MTDKEKLVEQLNSISSAFDLQIEDREALSQCKEMARAWDKLVYVQSFLEFLCKEGLENDIFGFAIWKLVCKNLSITDNRLRKFECIETCKKEIEKWITK